MLRHNHTKTEKIKQFIKGMAISLGVGFIFLGIFFLQFMSEILFENSSEKNILIFTSFLIILFIIALIFIIRRFVKTNNRNALIGIVLFAPLPIVLLVVLSLVVLVVN